MECFVSMSFSMPLCSPHAALKEINMRKLAFGRLSSKAASTTATNLTTLCSSNRGMFSVNCSNHQHLTSSSKHSGEIVSCFLDVSSCTRMTITGYWVGPDIDDGWGFVEAFVNRIT